MVSGDEGSSSTALPLATAGSAMNDSFGVRLNRVCAFTADWICARRSSSATRALVRRASRRKTIAWRMSGVVSTPVTVKMPSRSSTSEIRISSSEITSRRIWLTRAERG